MVLANSNVIGIRLDMKMSSKIRIKNILKPMICLQVQNLFLTYNNICFFGILQRNIKQTFVLIKLIIFREFLTNYFQACF